MPCYYEKSPGELREEADRLELHYHKLAEEEKLKEPARRKDREEASYENGILCALISELERQGLKEKFFMDASTNGMINILKLYELHKKTDRGRLCQILYSNFSEHELDLIKKILTGE